VNVDSRVHFEVLSGSGRLFAYASVVDNASQDAYLAGSVGWQSLGHA